MRAYRFIDTENANYRVTRLCSAWSVSRYAYYAWTWAGRRRPGSRDSALLATGHQVGQRGRRSWKKLHIAVDASGYILAAEVTPTP